jgi:pimeloyl-ACP methyl ester carboxylesterase
MKFRATKRPLAVVGFAALLVTIVLATQLSTIGAALILHPPHKRVAVGPPPGCEKLTLRGHGVDLEAWRGGAVGKRRGTLLYLHGVADNRASCAGVIERFRQRGFDVLAFDSRAHGDSGGEACTYGFYEKEDLRRVLDTLAPGAIVLVGSSLGGAVALQLAASDARVSAVVAAESFSDLRTVARERAPFFFTTRAIDRAFQIAEQKGHFQLDAVSPASAARDITAPVLLVHGAADTDTPPEHARLIFAALSGPKRLILVPGARHNHSLSGDDIWSEIERWIDEVLAARQEAAQRQPLREL